MANRAYLNTDQVKKTALQYLRKAVADGIVRDVDEEQFVSEVVEQHLDGEKYLAESKENFLQANIEDKTNPEEVDKWEQLWSGSHKYDGGKSDALWRIREIAYDQNRFIRIDWKWGLDEVLGWALHFAPNLPIKNLGMTESYGVYYLSVEINGKPACILPQELPYDFVKFINTLLLDEYTDMEFREVDSGGDSYDWIFINRDSDWDF